MLNLFCTKVLVTYMDSSLNMDSSNILKCNKFYRHMVLHVPEETQLKREFNLESAKKRAVRHFEGNLCFSGVLIVITGKANSY